MSNIRDNEGDWTDVPNDKKAVFWSNEYKANVPHTYNAKTDRWTPVPPTHDPAANLPGNNLTGTQ